MVRNDALCSILYRGKGNGYLVTNGWNRTWVTTYRLGVGLRLTAKARAASWAVRVGDWCQDWVRRIVAAELAEIKVRLEEKEMEFRKSKAEVEALKLELERI